MKPFRVAIVVILLLAAPHGVRASNDLGHIHNYYSSYTPFYHVNLTSFMHNASVWNETYHINPTDVVVGHADRTSSINDGVNLHDDYYGDTTWAARWSCLAYYSNRCLFSQIQYNLTHISSGNTDYHRAVACHEEGHALGLDHVSSTTFSCMVTPATSLKRIYSDHDISIINSKY